MDVRIRQFLSYLAATFWLIPALLVITGIGLALALVAFDDSEYVSIPVIENNLIYSGGGEGARTLLGAIASSTIGVAGTVFSITIAALALAAGQMGPRLLRNFVRDRGNQVTLGVLLGTFSYSLLVLRSVRTQDEGSFVPHLSVTVAIMLAILCVGMLVFFIGHVAGRINVDEVIELVSNDLAEAVESYTLEKAPQPAAPVVFTSNAVNITDKRRGYVQELDREQLADWAAEHGVVIELKVRPGDFVFPGATIARAEPGIDGIGEAIRRSTALGRRISRMDLEYPVRQLVEIAVRAMSPGINDPNTAISVIDRIGAVLCDIVPRHLSNGVTLRNGRPVLVTSATSYDGLADAMFHMIRQNAATSPAVLIRMIEIMTVVASCEHSDARRATLQRHVDLVMDEAERSIASPADLIDLLERQTRFAVAVRAQNTPALE